MPNAKDADLETYERILMVGPTGSGKTKQIWSLPGKKFAYIFDPNSMSALKGLDLDYELFMPEVQDMDMTLKGFNKNPVTGKTFIGDKPTDKKPREPKLWNNWGDHFNDHYDKGFFLQYNWLIFDSFTFITKAVMDRQLYINNRYGETEDKADYKIVGAKIAEVFGTIATMDINIYATGHLAVFEDEKTKKIETLLHLPGRARNMIPLNFTNIWLAQVNEGGKYEIRTKPDPRGLKDIRTSVPGLGLTEDVTIKTFGPESTRYGIGGILSRNKPAIGAQDAVRKASTG